MLHPLLTLCLHFYETLSSYFQHLHLSHISTPFATITHQRVNILPAFLQERTLSTCSYLVVTMVDFCAVSPHLPLSPPSLLHQTLLSRACLWLASPLFPPHCSAASLVSASLEWSAAETCRQRAEGSCVGRRRERPTRSDTTPGRVAVCVGEHRLSVEQRQLALSRSSACEWGWCCSVAPGRTNAWERRKVRTCVLVTRFGFWGGRCGDHGALPAPRNAEDAPTEKKSCTLHHFCVYCTEIGSCAGSARLCRRWSHSSSGCGQHVCMQRSPSGHHHTLHLPPAFSNNPACSAYKQVVTWEVTVL